ncbi:hypothetical protein JR316_0011758 [Psilocybe cubensis]|uniref:Uncharacterized protein n=1 Tax=Psilocybe cubensis TaxID=181762 RepID=A0ACB8GLC7_PSICU|nr:hypothetical protein JR316_0011758 [Psilocybe cubensis]KAH9476187.1 hypothetical protein JR316_0011758 [Psilocybe cubensis]
MNLNSSFVLAKELKNPGIEHVDHLLFSSNGKFLVAAGDRDKVFIWNTETFRTEQVLENKQWGQVSCLAWAYTELPSREPSTVLCVGNVFGGMSMFLMDSRSVKPFTERGTVIQLFTPNDIVENLVFDKINGRLIASSHSGAVKMYSVDAVAGSANLVWEAPSNRPGIPTSVLFFGSTNEKLLSFGLENGDVCCRDASNGEVLWTKKLASGIGSAAISSDQTVIIVNNLNNGNFDVYQTPDMSPLQTLAVGDSVTTHKYFIKQCRFIEGTKLSVCGSHTNKTLTSSPKEAHMTQAIAVTMAESRKVCIAASSNGFIYLWEKRSQPFVGVGETQTQPANTLLHYARTNGPFIAFVMACTYANWAPYLFALFAFLTSKAQYYGLLNANEGNLENLEL